MGWRKEYCPKHPGTERAFCTPCSHGARERIPTGTFRVTARGDLKRVPNKRK